MSGQASRIEDFAWGCMEWLSDSESHDGAEASLARMIIKPGVETPLHRHDNCSETIHVLAGVVEVLVSDVTPNKLSEGETHVIPLNVPHRFANPSKAEAILMLAYSSGNRHYSELKSEVA